MLVLTPIFCFILSMIEPAAATPTPVPPPPPSPIEEKVPGSKTEWFEFKPLKNLKGEGWGDHLTDIENHLHPSLGIYYRDKDKVTWAHETTHGIHSWLNTNMQKDRTHYYYYVGNNKATKIPQPKFKISDVARMIPPLMQKGRYNLYLIKQQSGWNNEPLYLWDEWVAYCNGAECGVELINKKLIKIGGKTDSSFGALEFAIYATHVAMAQKKHDPTYDNTQMLEFLAWNLERSMNIYNEGQKLKEYNWDDDKYLNNIRTHKDAINFRNFIIETYGRKYSIKVFGF